MSHLVNLLLINLFFSYVSYRFRLYNLKIIIISDYIILNKSLYYDKIQTSVLVGRQVIILTNDSSQQRLSSFNFAIASMIKIFVTGGLHVIN